MLLLKDTTDLFILVLDFHFNFVDTNGMSEIQVQNMIDRPVIFEERVCFPQTMKEFQEYFCSFFWHPWKNIIACTIEGTFKKDGDLNNPSNWPAIMCFMDSVGNSIVLYPRTWKDSVTDFKYSATLSKQFQELVNLKRFLVTDRGHSKEALRYLFRFYSSFAVQMEILAARYNREIVPDVTPVLSIESPLEFPDPQYLQFTQSGISYLMAKLFGLFVFEKFHGGNADRNWSNFVGDSRYLSDINLFKRTFFSLAIFIKVRSDLVQRYVATAGYSPLTIATDDYCSICGSVCSEGHMQSKHSIWFCKKCFFCFKSNSGLARHMEVCKKKKK